MHKSWGGGVERRSREKKEEERKRERRERQKVQKAVRERKR